MKARHLQIIVLLLFLGFSQNSLQAQDLEKLKDLTPKKLLKGKGIDISGMVAANHVFYNATGIPNRNIPVNILYTGSLNLNIFDKIKMPVSFSFSNQNINFAYPFNKDYRFAQPFNRFVLKPRYKSLTLHLGTASMNFSPYTLAGHRFEGIGVEFKPKSKPFYIAAMSGNLLRAVRVDSNFTVRNNRPSYKRFGWGVMGGLKKEQDKVEVIFFTAADRLSSLPYSLDALNIAPMANTVMSVKAEKSIYKVWQLGTEIAYSGITTDTRALPQVATDAFRPSFFGTISPLATTEYNKAINGYLNYRGKTFTAGLDYSRVDPGYRTLGAYFFNNDLETFAFKGASQFLEGKVSLNGNVGVQQDNVNNQKIKTQKRVVGAANITVVPSDKINLFANFSNFSSYSNLQSTFDYLTQATPYNYLDTLTYRQINQNIQAGGTWQLPTKNEDNKQSLAFNAVLQNGSDEQGKELTTNDLYNINIDHSLDFSKKTFTVATALYWSKANFGNQPNIQWGPSVAISKGFAEGKLTTNLNLIYTWGKLPAITETIANFRGGVAYTLKDKHQFRFDAIVLNRNAQSTERYIPSFRELTLTLGYVYNFTVFKAKIK